MSRQSGVGGCPASGRPAARPRPGLLLHRSQTLVALPRPFCLMCAEKRPEECHRLLIAEWLAGRGWEVVHLV
ncbi:MAG: DUF488 family protein [Armatimonadota bacterium]